MRVRRCRSKSTAPLSKRRVNSSSTTHATPHFPNMRNRIKITPCQLKKNPPFPKKKDLPYASTVPWAGDVWGSQRHGGECCISPADSRARAVGPGGSVRGPLCTLRQRRARSDGRNGARWPRFAIVAVLRAPVRTDVSIFRAPEIRAGSAACGCLG